MKVFCFFVEPASYTLDLASNVYDKNEGYTAQNLQKLNEYTGK